MTPLTRHLDARTVEELSRLQLSARRAVDGSATGLHRSGLKGASVEFRESRPYVPGDDPRRLDWRVLARTGRPFVKQSDEETNLRCVLAIDGSGSMGYGDKLDYAARVAAALAYLLLAAAESVGVAVLSPAVRQWLSPAAASGQVGRILQTLDDVRPDAALNPPAAAAALAERLRRRGVVIWASDFFQPVPAIRDALARLRYGRHQVACLRVIHPDEKSFPFRGWVRLAGMESEPHRSVEAAAVRRGYLARFDRHATDLTAACRSAGAELVTATTDRPVVETVRRLLGR